MKFKKFNWNDVSSSGSNIKTGLGSFTVFEEDDKWYASSPDGPTPILNIIFMSVYDSADDAKENVEKLVKEYIIDKFFEN